jgi:hypothetical protein
MVETKSIIEQLEVSKGEDIPFSNINLINTISEEEKRKLFEKSFASIYIDTDEYEVDIYNEVSLYLKDGTLLQNVIKQETHTSTPQFDEHSPGGTIKEYVQKEKLDDKIDSVIIYTQRFKEMDNRIIHDIKSVTVVNVAA